MASTMATTLNVQCVLNCWTFITNYEWSITHGLVILAKYRSLPCAHTLQKPNLPLREHWDDQMVSNTKEGLITGKQQRTLQFWKRGV